jgi:hypothetical protein
VTCPQNSLILPHFIMSGDTRSARSAKALQYASTALKGAAGVAALSPFPQVKIIFKLAHTIIEILQARLLAIVI